MIYLLQAVAILFSYMMARMQGPAVVHIENMGAPAIVATYLHRYGAWVKLIALFLCGGVLTAWHWHQVSAWALLHGVAAGIICFLCMYATFDIFLNIWRPNRSWDYIGLNDADGRRWQKWFGKKAGRIKAFILLALVIASNVIYQIL